MSYKNLPRELIDPELYQAAVGGLERTAKSVRAEQMAKLYEVIKDNCPSGSRPKYRAMIKPLADIAESAGVPFKAAEGEEAARDQAEHIRDKVVSLRNRHAPKEFGLLLLWAWTARGDLTEPILKAFNLDPASMIADARSRLSGRPVPVLAFLQEKSARDLSYLIQRATKRIVLIAQNHWYMINQEAGSDTDFWPKIKDALTRGASVEIVAMHRDAPQPFSHLPPSDAVGIWTRYLKEEQFPAHLAKCWATLDRFAAAYAAEKEAIERKARLRHKKAGTLKIYRAWFLPMTLSFVDPDHDDALVVVSPRTSATKSGTRPDFIFKQDDHPDLYSHYWSFASHGEAHQLWQQIN